MNKVRALVDELIWIYANDIGAGVIVVCLLIGVLKLPNALKTAAYEAKVHKRGAIAQIVKELMIPIEFIAASILLYLLRLAAQQHFLR